MNTYMKAQIENMIALTRTFEQACELASIQDDGMTNREEVRKLKKLHTATEKFRKELQAIK